MKLFLLIALLLLVSCSPASEEVYSPECPSGIVNDTFPGMCGSYTDSNDNGICDLSEKLY